MGIEMKYTSIYLSIYLTCMNGEGYAQPGRLGGCGRHGVAAVLEREAALISGNVQPHHTPAGVTALLQIPTGME